MIPGPLQVAVLDVPTATLLDTLDRRWVQLTIAGAWIIPGLPMEWPQATVRQLVDLELLEAAARRNDQVLAYRLSPAGRALAVPRPVGL